MNKSFYTIMIDDKFMNSNFMKDPSENIMDCIMFRSKEDARYYSKDFRKDLNYKIIKIKCNLTEI